MRRLIVSLAVALAGCTSSHPISYIAGFTPPAPAAGYTRYVTPTIDAIAPGDNVMFCQWIDAPHDADRQVLDTRGYQSAGGHHVALYATSEIQPVGTSRPCTTQDMLTVTFVGAVGAEGVSSAKLPDGLAFTVPAGYALMTNTHYINTTDAPIDAQSVVDVKLGDPAHPLPAVGNIAVNYDTFTIPAGARYTSDAYCKATTQLSIFMWADHMHEWGARVWSELVRADGTKVMLAEDDAWSKELTFDPLWTRWDIATPLVVMPGDEFHVQCTWQNTTSAALTFPDEMCVATGFTLEAMPQSVCEASTSP